MRPSRWLLLLLPLFFSTQLFAGTYNYRSLLIGERAVGLGGAYVALSNSGEGGFYNPAGLAFVDRTTMSVAGNFYTLTRGSRKSALKFAGDEADLSQDSLTGIPQIASFVKRINLPWEETRKEPLNAIAFNVVATEQTDLFGRVDFDVASGQALLTRSVRDGTIYIGPSYARQINERFSLGVSAFYVLRLIQNTAFIYQNDTNALGQGFLQDNRSIGSIAGKIGARYSPVDRLWLGLTYQPPSLRVHSDGSLFSSIIAQDKATSDVTHSINDQQNLKPNDRLPHTIVGGIAYGKEEHWMITGDTHVYIRDSYDVYSNLASAKVKRNTTVNFSVGTEYYVKPNVPIRLGTFSNFSSAPTVQDGTFGQPDHVDFLGFSLTGGIGSENTTLTAGTVVSLGWGDGVDNQGNKIKVSQNNYSVLLAGSYKF